MKISTAGKNPSNFRITVAVAILAGAGLSGCASDRSHESARYTQASYTQVGYTQPVYQSGRWIDPPANRNVDPRSMEPSGRGNCCAPSYQAQVYYQSQH
jgi:uncharacterized protein YceK